MDRITDVQIGPLIDSKYIQCYKVNFKQNDQQRQWDCLRQHDSVAVLIYNKTNQTLVVVSQFRPAVYMSSNRHVWKNSSIFKGASLSMKSTKDTPISTSGETTPPSYGPGSEGFTYELCAGIVDKQTSLEQIAKEEILEETGYDVPMEEIRYITNFWSNIGTAGSLHTVFYCEVTEDMHVGRGGGNPKEGEQINIIHIPIDQIDDVIYDTTKKKSTGLGFAFMWFSRNILPGIKIKS